MKWLHLKSIINFLNILTMKKFLLTLVLCGALFSCSKEQIDENSESQTTETQLILKKGLRSASCSLFNPAPFTEATNTYLLECESNPSLGCFIDELTNNVRNETSNQFGIPSFTKTIKEYVADGLIHELFVTTITGPGDFYPTTSAANANLIFEEVACTVVNDILALPNLPSSNQYYGIVVNYAIIDYIDEDEPVINFDYTIYKYTNL